MSVKTAEHQSIDHVSRLLERIGSVPLERIALFPSPGTATEEDILSSPGGEKRMYELVEGVLVEKPVSYYESRLAAVLMLILGNFLREHPLGILLGAYAQHRLLPGLVRLPNVSFVSWNQFSNHKLPRTVMLNRAPDLAVEVISPGNTPEEMNRKVLEYFSVGVRLVWYVYPEMQTVDVYTSPIDRKIHGPDEVVDGGEVLPGFRLNIREWFQEAGEREE